MSVAIVAAFGAPVIKKRTRTHCGRSSTTTTTGILFVLFYLRSRDLRALAATGLKRELSNRNYSDDECARATVRNSDSRVQFRQTIRTNNIFGGKRRPYELSENI